MILVVDVDYRDEYAVVAGVCFQHWQDEAPLSVNCTRVLDIEEYEPGAFYKREMPCILALMTEHKLQPSIIIIDGFVVLGDDDRPGLGMHLYNTLENTLEQKIPVIGVAKKPFKDTREDTAILRGKSTKPLYVTSVGIDQHIAKEYILSMHGQHRIPTLLKLVDRECRNRFGEVGAKPIAL